ncbi:hypothetical protein [Rhodopirellula bahusiensis]|uniref:Uncharacterized protein n=1 Tax=Rhodopirellula bahusiensis TaxID=2014065 RepID=A0A2G1VXY1_9BACT|nr:hypothetical protein [Rhodopirellula bahusiensis]PHQ31634.1 hypothetical protein CEE69_30145 [Rhodopirellula bahusiensis]
MVDPTPRYDVGNHFDVVHDVRGDASASDSRSDSGPDGTPGNPRPFIGIQFRCCQTYGRIYRNDQRTAYRGRCPKCGARMEIPIGSGGTNKRFFSAG